MNMEMLIKQPVSLPNVVVSQPDPAAENASLTVGETVGEHLILTGRRSTTSYVCRTTTQVSTRLPKVTQIFPTSIENVSVLFNTV